MPASDKKSRYLTPVFNFIELQLLESIVQQFIHGDWTIEKCFIFIFNLADGISFHGLLHKKSIACGTQ